MEMNRKMKVMIREICFYVLFLFLLLFVVNTNQDGNTYYQNADLVNTYTSDMDQVRY